MENASDKGIDFLRKLDMYSKQIAHPHLLILHFDRHTIEASFRRPLLPISQTLTRMILSNLWEKKKKLNTFIRCYVELCWKVTSKQSNGPVTAKCPQHVIWKAQNPCADTKMNGSFVITFNFAVGYATKPHGRYTTSMPRNGATSSITSIAMCCYIIQGFCFWTTWFLISLHSAYDDFGEDNLDEPLSILGRASFSSGGSKNFVYGIKSSSRTEKKAFKKVYFCTA